MKNKPITGILWWKPKQWEKAKKISADSHKFDDTYQEWKEGAERAFKNLQDLGITVYKIEIDLEELVTWCEDKQVPLNASARSEFVSGKVKEHHESQE